VRKNKLDNYVRRAVRKGLPEELIMQKMVKAGFSEIDVHQAVKRTQYGAQNVKKEPRGLCLIFTLIPLIICFVIYMGWLPISNGYFIKIKQVLNLKVFIILAIITVVMTYFLSSKRLRAKDKSSSSSQSGLSTEVHKIERITEKQAVDFKKSTRSQGIRLGRIIVVVVYIIVLGMATYLIMVSLFPDKLPVNSATYTINAGDTQLFNPLSSFYIDNPSVFGDKVALSNNIVQPIISSKDFNIVFVPKTFIPQNTSATLLIHLLFSNSSASDVYLDDELIFPSLEDYKLILENHNDYVYINKDIYKYNKGIVNSNDNTCAFICRGSGILFSCPD